MQQHSFVVGKCIVKLFFDIFREAFYIVMLSFATVIIEDSVLINNSSVEHAVAIAIRSAN